METKTYLIKTDYDYKTKQVVQIDGNTLTIQFRIMDNYSMLEIKGRLKDRGIEEFTHQILCHKDQDLTILEAKNDQVDQADNMESVYKDRISIDRGFDIISSNDLANKKQDPIIGLHGENLNDQKDRISIDRGHDIISSNDLGFDNDKKEDPIMGLHGQLDLEDLISEKEGS